MRLKALSPCLLLSYFFVSFASFSPKTLHIIFFCDSNSSVSCTFSCSLAFVINPHQNREHLQISHCNFKLFNIFSSSIVVEHLVSSWKRYGIYHVVTHCLQAFNRQNLTHFFRKNLCLSVCLCLLKRKFWFNLNEKKIQRTAETKVTSYRVTKTNAQLEFLRSNSRVNIEQHINGQMENGITEQIQFQFVLHRKIL